MLDIGHGLDEPDLLRRLAHHALDLRMAGVADEQNRVAARRVAQDRGVYA